MQTFQRSERWRGEPAAPQKHATSSPTAAAAILALQRSIGNRAVTKLTVSGSGRRLMRNGWSVKSIDDERTRVRVEMSGKWGPEITLHHTISQDRWSSVAKDLDRSMSQSADHDLHAAAKDFWDAVQDAAGRDIMLQTAKRQDPIAAA